MRKKTVARVIALALCVTVAVIRGAAEEDKGWEKAQRPKGEAAKTKAERKGAPPVTPNPLSENVAGKARPGEQPASPSQKSDWGEPSHAVQTRVTSPTETEQGMPLELTLEFRANPQTDEPKPPRLNGFLLRAFLQLSLVDPRTSRRFVVRPHDPTQGMPVFDQGEDAVLLHAGSSKSWRVEFPLATLYDELRPGRYACQVRYSFPEEATRFWAGSEQEWRKAGFWSGTVVSERFDLELKPETPKTTALLLPKRLRVAKEPVQLHLDDQRKTDVPVVRFRSKDAERVTLPVRNGHFMMAQCSRDGEFYRLSAPPKPDDANAIDTWYDYRGGDKKVAYTIEIFETRDPVGHHEVLPSRESGGYKVLWKKTFVVSVLSGR